jgi:hypothetical protein
MGLNHEPLVSDVEPASVRENAHSPNCKKILLDRLIETPQDHSAVSPIIGQQASRRARLLRLQKEETST